MLDRANKLNAPPRQLIRRHYRKHRRDNAPAHAFAGAKLWMHKPVVPSTQAEAARLVGSTPAYVAAAATVINAATPGLIENVLRGRVPLLAAAHEARRRQNAKRTVEEMVASWRCWTPGQRANFGRAVGVAEIWDDAIAPVVGEERGELARAIAAE